MGKGYLSLPKRWSSARGSQSNSTQLEASTLSKKASQFTLVADPWSLNVEHLEGVQQKNLQKPIPDIGIDMDYNA